MLLFSLKFEFKASFFKFKKIFIVLIFKKRKLLVYVAMQLTLDQAKNNKKTKKRTKHLFISLFTYYIFLLFFKQIILHNILFLLCDATLEQNIYYYYYYYIEKYFLLFLLFFLCIYAKFYIYNQKTHINNIYK